MFIRRIVNNCNYHICRQFKHYYCDKKISTESKLKETVTIKPAFSRFGDKGNSRTVSGEILPKDHRIFEAIGSTEELLSFLGLVREYGIESEHEYIDKLKRIQTVLIEISTAISRYKDKTLKTIPVNYTTELEQWIEKYSCQLPPPEDYIIPGGGVSAASLHVARAICRRTERVIVPLIRDELVDKEALVYLNRLSDFLFTLSRLAAKFDKCTESIYIPKAEEKIQEQ